MDPVTVGAVLLTVVTGATEALGGQLWAAVTALVRRPARGNSLGRRAVGLGGAELTALEQTPADQRKAVPLARVLLARAAADSEFDRALRQWWQQAETVRAQLGNVTNTVSGGTQHGPMLQGRDFTGITFGAAPPSPSAPLQPDPAPS